MSVLRVGLSAWIALLAWTAMESQAEEPGIVLRILSPRPDAVVGDPDGLAFVEGRALALMGAYRSHDIVFAIDTSRTTAEPSGLDIDGDGTIGEQQRQFLGGLFSRQPGHPDSILAMQLALVRAALEGVDPRETRVGLVAFPGLPEGKKARAFTDVPLTSDLAEVRLGLDRILEMGSEGSASVAEALAHAGNELIGAGAARSSSREGTTRILAFFVGSPIRPQIAVGKASWKRGLSTSDVVASRGIRIDTFAVTEQAISATGPLVEIASSSGGTYTPVRQLNQVKLRLEPARFADTSLLQIRNATSGDRSGTVLQSRDGRFVALVSLDEGENTLEVRVRAANGREARRRVVVTYDPEAPPHPLTPAQRRRRQDLLEAWN